MHHHDLASKSITIVVAGKIRRSWSPLTWPNSTGQLSLDIRDTETDGPAGNADERHPPVRDPPSHSCRRDPEMLRQLIARNPLL